MENRSHRQFEQEVSAIVLDGLANSMFTACSFGSVHPLKNSKNKQDFYFGQTGSITNPKDIDASTVFDLASLTKPLVVSLLIMQLCEQDELATTDSLKRFYGKRAGRFAEVTVHELLHHCSGLPAHRPYFSLLMRHEEQKRKDILLEAIFSEQQSAHHDTCEYSDLGYMVLGNIIEELAGERLSTYWQRTIAKPLGLEEMLFFPEIQRHRGHSYVATGICSWSNNELIGVVNDDNCRAMGGVAGHAGLFGTLEGVLRLTEELLSNYQGKNSALSFSLKKYLTSGKKICGRWLYGFDTPSPQDSTSGRYFSANSIGHLGFTGTSFWLDLDQELSIVLLTNRVLTNGNIEKMRNFRRKIYDCGMEYLLQIEEKKKP